MEGLDPLIHQHTRLRIMGALYRNRRLSFTALRDALDLTDGNLGSHARKLEDGGYVRSGRVLRDLSFEVVYVITRDGDRAMRLYLTNLREILESLEPEPVQATQTATPHREQA